MTTDYGVKGTTLYITAGSSTFVQVGQVKTIDGPGMKVGKRDATHLESSIKEPRPTMGDPQELSGTVVYHAGDAGQVAFQTQCTTPSTWVVQGSEIKIVLPTTTKFFRFFGFPTNFQPTGGDEEGTWMAAFSLQVASTIIYPTT